jgi:MFS family permease
MSSVPNGIQDQGGMQLHRWTDRTVIALAVMALASGFGQFGAVAALGDVSRQLGHIAHGTSIGDQVGLSGTDLGIGLAIIRLASLFSLPLVGLADRLGRRRLLVEVTILGLVLTIVAAASPGYWWFVVIFALGRPLLSATNALTQVMATEETDSHDRSKAVSLIAAGYGIGAGLAAVIHSLASGTLGFRGIFALTVIPLGVTLVIRRWVEEPDRFTVSHAATDHPLPVFGAVTGPYRNRVIILCALGLAISVITGPANSFVFLYAQDVLHLKGYVTAAMVVASGATGLGGLLIGRWLADHIGRRPTCTMAIVAMSVLGVVTYSGSRVLLVVGYVLAVLSGSVLAPSIGSLLTELFPTSIRASVAGWWVAAGVIGAVAGLLLFGSIAGVGNHFAVAARFTFLPIALTGGLFWFLPETKGKEPEDLLPAE